MKRKIPIGSLIFIASSVIASLWGSEPCFLSYEDWEEVSTQFQGNKHQIVLKNGSKLYGTLEKIPSLSYTFTSLDFDPHEILVVTTVQTPQAIKLQYVTHSGQNYIASSTVDRFVFTTQEPDLNGNSREVKKEIDPLLIDYILLNRPTIPYAGYNSKLSSLEFQNGDQLPVILLSDPIVITDGWSEKKLKVSDIIQLSFQGGLCAKVYKEGRQVDIDFSYVKEPYLWVQLERNKHHMKFPWSQIAIIQTANGGFYREHPLREPRTLTSQPNASSRGRDSQKIGLGWMKRHDVPDQMGLKAGEALNDAFGTISLSSEAIASIRNLGNEPIIALDPLFDEREEELWLANIVVDEFEHGEDVSEQAIAELDLVGCEHITALDPQFTENPHELEEGEFFLSDWIFPLFNEELINEDYVLYTFNNDDFDVENLQDHQTNPIPLAEDFEVQDNNEMNDLDDSQLDYLEDIAREVDMASISLEIQDSLQVPLQPPMIGIDEIISQEEGFYDSENIDPAELIDLLWNQEEKDRSINSRAEEALLDALLPKRYTP